MPLYASDEFSGLAELLSQGKDSSKEIELALAMKDIYRPVVEEIRNTEFVAPDPGPEVLDQAEEAAAETTPTRTNYQLLLEMLAHPATQIVSLVILLVGFSILFSLFLPAVVAAVAAIAAVAVLHAVVAAPVVSEPKSRWADLRKEQARESTEAGRAECLEAYTTTEVTQSPSP